MPTISRFCGILIQMFHNDHTPPEILEGYLPRREARLVQAWGELHKQQLLDNWNTASV